MIENGMLVCAGLPTLYFGDLIAGLQHKSLECSHICKIWHLQSLVLMKRWVLQKSWSTLFVSDWSDSLVADNDLKGWSSRWTIRVSFLTRLRRDTRFGFCHSQQFWRKPLGSCHSLVDGSALCCSRWAFRMVSMRIPWRCWSNWSALRWVEWWVWHRTKRTCSKNWRACEQLFRRSMRNSKIL